METIAKRQMLHFLLAAVLSASGNFAAGIECDLDGRWYDSVYTDRMQVISSVSIA